VPADGRPGGGLAAPRETKDSLAEAIPRRLALQQHAVEYWQSHRHQDGLRVIAAALGGGGAGVVLAVVTALFALGYGAALLSRVNARGPAVV
jgi:hypothetical protein